MNVDCRSCSWRQRNYFLSGRKFVDVGGLGWTIKKMHSGDLVMSEGIHIPGRVYIGMVCQIGTCNCLFAGYVILLHSLHSSHRSFDHFVRQLFLLLA